MKLNKNCSYKEYFKLVEYADKNNLQVIENGNFFETVQIKINLDFLKKQKKEELKQKRDNYKKTIKIKDGFYLSDLNSSTNNYFNLVRLKFGWTEKDLNKYDEEMEKIVEKYDLYNYQINNCKSEEEINKIKIVF